LRRPKLAFSNAVAAAVTKDIMRPYVVVAAAVTEDVVAAAVTAAVTKRCGLTAIMREHLASKRGCPSRNGYLKFQEYHAEVLLIRPTAFKEPGRRRINLHADCRNSVFCFPFFDVTS
jgi:hypothetical protein